MTAAQCLCGEFRWEIDGPVGAMSHCYCSMCRKTHGAPFATHARIAAKDLRFVKSGTRRRYESSPGFFRDFCGRCGAVIPEAEPTGETAYVAAGAFETDPGGRPQAHIFVASKAPWFEITDDLAQFDAYPASFDSPVIAPREPLPRQHPGSTRGSCLCGGAAWELTGHLDIIVHCHCSRCRQSRAAAYHANLFANSDDVHWIQGADLRESYSLPDANFRHTFCRVCGSTVPGSGEHRRLGIPAAALDDDPRAKNRIHIFCGSKAPWFELTDSLPAFVEGPGSADYDRSGERSTGTS